MDVFRAHLGRNETWLRRIVTANADYVRSDFEKFVGQFQPMWSRARLTAAFTFTLRRQREAWRDAGMRWKLVKPYRRLWAFFTAYAAMKSGPAHAIALVEQLYLWRAARSIAVGMVFSTTQLGIVDSRSKCNTWCLAK
jgi:hypothetical protein